MSKAVLIIGHGSTLMFNKMTMEAQAEVLKEMGRENIYIGFNETSMPSIEDAMMEMAYDGVDEVVALPFFIASGLHMTRDIPPKLGLSNGESEMVTDVDGKKILVHFETPFGEDPNLTDILCEKIEEISSGSGNLGVIVMGHGSRLGYNSDIMELNAARLRERGYQNVYVGYNEFNSPTISETIERMKEDGMDQIIALPLFIASGKHLSKDVPASLGIPERCDSAKVLYKGREISIRYATPVGGDPRLCRVLDKKIAKYYG
jgi:sirohydrochlorin ferrochelatase